MNSLAHGNDILPVEVTHISCHGVWLLVDGVEYFMPHDQFPWFKDASVADVFDVELLNEGHLYWSQLDVDLSVASIEAPHRFPLVFNENIST